MDKATIRVNQETLSKFVGNLVRFVGQLKEVQSFFFFFHIIKIKN